MMELHEFKWEPTSTEGGGQGLDLRIVHKDDGTYRLINLKDQSQICECEDADEVTEQFNRLFQQSSESPA